MKRECSQKQPNDIKLLHKWATRVHPVMVFARCRNGIMPELSVMHIDKSVDQPSSMAAGHRIHPKAQIRSS